MEYFSIAPKKGRWSNSRYTGVVVEPKADKKKDVERLVGVLVGDKKRKGTDHSTKRDPNTRRGVPFIQTPELGLVSFL